MMAENVVPPSLNRKISREKRVRTEPGFPKMGPVHYLEWLGKLHKEHSPKLYFEIGTESGASLSLTQCASIAVDPEFKIEPGVIGKHPELHLFQQKSDVFFETGFLGKLDQRVDLAFLDGMHLIEYLLRDIINIEQNMMPGGQILAHDCIPMSFAAAERNWDKKKTRAWTGDVWKIIPILHKYRPDLKVSVLDLAPSGLLVVENLDPDNTILTENYQRIVDEFVPISLEDYGLDRFTKDLQLKSAGFPEVKKKMTAGKRL